MTNKLPAIGLLFVLIIHFIPGATQMQWPGKDWPSATPASQSMSADSLKAFDDRIASGQFGYIDEMLVIRYGKIVYHKTYSHDYGKIYEKQASKKDGLNQLDPGGPYNYYNDWWHPFYRQGNLHTLQSVTKTITSIIIGVAMQRGDFPGVKTPILNFFDINEVKNIDDRKRRITVEHLLTMSSGLEWNEYLPYSDPGNDAMVMEASCDWVQYVIDKPVARDPGQEFKYNSGGSQLLSYIFRKATGKDIEEYAAEYLFLPLGISDYFWKRTPTGLPDTEGGLYLSGPDLARIFYLYLANGNWNGKQIVSTEWVKSSVSPAMTVGRGVKYGYKWWLHDYNNGSVGYAWCGTGFGGQLPVVIPEYNMVAVFTGWNIARGPSLPVTEAIRILINAVVNKQ
jgi:CubicO group peptidase (beta-lactamase class C family)